MAFCVRTFLSRIWFLLKLQLAQTDGRTDSHPDYNSSLHSDHLYIHNPISNSICLRWCKQSLGEQNNYTL